MIKVSVIVPVYNKQNEIERCLNSLVKQTLSDIEIIVINDGSTDNSLQIINKFRSNYPTLIKVVDQTNQGIGRTRNNGLKISNGEYIGFVDGDDYVDIDMYSQYYEFAVSNNLDIVNSYYKKVFGNKIVEFGRNTHPIINLQKYPKLINEIEYGPCSKIFRREVIIKHNIEFQEHLKYEDVPFVLKNYYHATRIGYLDKPLYNYCIMENSETTVVDEKVFDIFEILKIINDYFVSKTSELEYLNIRLITKYMLQQKNQVNKNIKLRFIDKGYDILSKEYPCWKKNPYYKNEPIIKRFVKNNKAILMMYCSLGR